MRFLKRLAAIATLALLGGSPPRADTVDVTSTTLLRLGQETRGGQSAQKPDLATVAPAFEILSISARGVKNPLVDDLAIVVSTWGSYELADRRWDDGTGSNLTGDVVTGYLQGKLLDRRLTLRIGREQVATGVARMIHIDGAEAVAAIPVLNLRLSAYGGVPVSQRFTTRRAIYNWNPAGGDLAYGARVAWSYGFAGSPGRGIDIGLSANIVQDGKDPVRQEGAWDLRFQPLDTLAFTGFAAASAYDNRWSEVSGRVLWNPIRILRVEADAKYMAPDLLLSRNSILSVFTAEERQQYGGGFFLRLARGVQAALIAHLDVEQGRNFGDKNYLGSEAEARIEWERGHTLAGAEILFLDALENGYYGGRIFGRRDMGRFFAAADVLAHFFREKVNGETMAITGALTGGMELARGFSAVISGRAGVTPFFEQTFDVMAKLVYNSSYQVREVR